MEWRIASIGDNVTIEFAVQELKNYITSIDSNIDVAIMKVDTYQDSMKNVLWVGISNIFSPYLVQVDEPSKDDVVYINVMKGEGIITGTNERSVLIAAYRFLREAGCRWIRPGADGEYIPKKSLENLLVTINEKATYRHRGVCIEGATSFDHVMRMINWLPKIGMNGYFN